MKSKAAKRDTGRGPLSKNAAGTGIVCWTRMQAEAGQDINLIISRKELERKAGDGLFCWGIGNAPPRSLGQVARQNSQISVIFSLMKSRPRAADLAPTGIMVWRSYFDLDGVERLLPPHALITSGAKSSARPHYALMCHTHEKLALADLGVFDPSAYLNVSEAARPVGSSQVTALLRKVGTEAEPSGYRINLRASLARSLWVKLGNPVDLSNRKRSELAEALQHICEMGVADWINLTLAVRGEKKKRKRMIERQLALFSP